MTLDTTRWDTSRDSERTMTLEHEDKTEPLVEMSWGWACCVAQDSLCILRHTVMWEWACRRALQPLQQYTVQCSLRHCRAWTCILSLVRWYQIRWWACQIVCPAVQRPMTTPDVEIVSVMDQAEPVASFQWVLWNVCNSPHCNAMWPPLLSPQGCLLSPRSLHNLFPALYCPVITSTTCCCCHCNFLPVHIGTEIADSLFHAVPKVI